MDQLSEAWAEKQFALAKYGEDLLDTVAGLPENYSELYSTHPSVAFYSGVTPLTLNVGLLPKAVVACANRFHSPVEVDGSSQTRLEEENANNAGIFIHMHVIQFHQFMSNNEWRDSEEGEGGHGMEGLHSSPESTASMEVLRVNWRTIMNHLFPSISVDSADREAECEYPLDKTSWRELRGRGTILLDRILMSYSIIVQFFGWKVHREETGELDRHRGWRGRYDQLAQYTHTTDLNTSTEDRVKSCGLEYSTSNFYHEVTRLIRVLQELRMNIYATNLVQYIVEEMSKGRLLFLQPLAGKFWVPQIEKDDETTSERKRAIRKKFDRIGESDSD